MKAVQILRIALSSSSDKPTTTIASTISSDGKIHIYDLAELPTGGDAKLQLNPVAVYDTKGTRLTCLALADGEASSSAPAHGKRKRNEDEGAEDSEDDHQEWDVQAENGASIDDQQEEIEGEYEDEDEDDSGSDEE